MASISSPGIAGVTDHMNGEGAPFNRWVLKTGTACVMRTTVEAWKQPAWL